MRQNKYVYMDAIPLDKNVSENPWQPTGRPSNKNISDDHGCHKPRENHGIQKPQDDHTFQKAWENSRYQTRTIQNKKPKVQEIEFWNDRMQCLCFCWDQQMCHTKWTMDSNIFWTSTHIKRNI